MLARTTESLPFDPEKEIQGLRKVAAYAARLHPRRVASALPLNASKLGGMILWPEEEPWPICEQGHLDDEPPHRVPYEPLVQLRKEDAVDWLFPADADLMQLLWCPHQHMATDEEEGQINSGYHLAWRRERDVKRARREAPRFEGPVWAHPLRECEFHPEPLWDYPDYFDLEDRLQRRVSEWRPSVSRGASKLEALESFDFGSVEGATAEVMDLVRRSLTEGAVQYRD